MEIQYKIIKAHIECGDTDNVQRMDTFFKKTLKVTFRNRVHFLKMKKYAFFSKFHYLLARAIIGKCNIFTLEVKHTA
jgi:hypothetical protein